jgi:hypothetical protein
MPLTCNNSPSLPYCRFVLPTIFKTINCLAYIPRATTLIGERALKPCAYRACRCNVMHVVQGSLNSLCACRFFDHFVASPAESMHSWRRRLAQCLAVPFDTAVVRLFCVLQAMLVCLFQHQACHEHEPVCMHDACCWLHYVVWSDLIC